MPAAPKMVDFYSPDADAVLQVPADQAALMREGGYKVGEDAQNAYIASGVGGTIASGLLGAAHGATFGLADLAIPDSLKPLAQAMEDEHPLAHGIGTVAGGIAPFIATDGLSAAAGLGLAGQAAARVTTAAIGSGVEAAAESSKTDSPLTAERVLGAVGIGTAMAAFGEGVGYSIGEAVPALQRSANRYLKRAVDEGQYKEVPWNKLGVPTREERAINSAASNKIVDDLGGAEGIFGKEPVSPIAPDPSTAPPATPTTPKGPPPLPEKPIPDYVSQRAPSEEEVAYDPQQYAESKRGEALGFDTRPGDFVGQEPPKPPLEMHGPPDIAEALESRSSKPDFDAAARELYPEDSVGAPPRRPTITDQEKEDMYNLGYRKQTNANQTRPDFIDPTYRKSGPRPFGTIANTLKTAGKILGGGGLLGSAVLPHPAGAIGLVGGAAYGASRVLGGIDDVALMALNNQRSINRLIDDVASPFMKQSGKVVRQITEGAIDPTVEHVFGADDVDGAYQAAAEVLPRMATDPASMNAYYDKVYGPVFNTQPAFYGNLVAKGTQAVQYINSQLPQDPRQPSLIPQPYNPTRSQKVEFLHKLKAVNDPLEVMKNPTVEGMQAIQAVYPETLNLMRSQILAGINGRKEPLSPQHAKTLSIALGGPVDASLSPQYIASLQQTAASAQQPAQPASGPPGKPGPKPKSVTVSRNFANIAAPGSQQNEVENTQ